jgi:tetratricopeptide (TPR) repeat protein
VATNDFGPAGPPNLALGAAPRLSPGRWLILALLAAATFAIFAGALRSGWLLLDDSLYVYGNPHINRGWRFDQALWLLSHPHGENWHPLTSWSHLLDVQLFGLVPVGHHAVNLVLHALNAVLLAVVLFRLTGAWWRSVLVAALFAFHPLRVESVAWISERKDLLSGLFFLLTIESYRRWAVRPGRVRYAALVAALALGLMSKSMLVTLPFVLVLLDIWPLGRLQGMTRNPAVSAPAFPLIGLITEKWPLFMLSIVSAAATFLVQRQVGAVASAGLTSPVRRVLNALVSYWRYIEKTFWPHDLAVLYPYGNVMEYGAAAAVAAGIVAVSALFLWQSRRRPYLLVGWLWYLGMLVPVIGLIQVGGQAYADRYTYLPTIGLVVALVWLAGDLAARSRPGRAVVVVVCSLALVGLSVGTVQQVARWKDNRTLFSHTVAVTRDNPIALMCLGDLAFLAGDFRLALQHYQAAARLAPGWAEVRTKLGGAVLMALSKATVQQVVLWRDPQTVFGHDLAVTRGDPVANEKLGELLLLEGKPQLAIDHFEEVLRIQPGLAEANVNLAIALSATDGYDAAVGHFRTGLRSKGTANGHTLFGFALARLGRMDEAIAEYRTALRIEPDRVVTLVQLSAALGARGRLLEAASCLQRAVDLAPANDETRRLLAVTLVRAGRLEDAIRAYGGILRQSPDDLDALNNVAWIRATCADARLRDGAEAVRLAERARDRSPEPVAVFYSTLGAAYAEAGRFPEAITACGRAIELARSGGEPQAAIAFQQQLARYRAGRPFRFEK